MRFARLAAELILLFCLAPTAGWAATENYTGRPVIEVLAELRAPGLEFVYSSELLPPELRVLAEPRARDRLTVASEILAPHLLRLSIVRPGLYAVTRMREGPAPGTVSGRIVNDASSRPVAGARIELQPLGVVQWSGSDGGFAFRSVPQCDCTLAVQAPGFQRAELSYATGGSASAELELRLTAALPALDEVVVATSRYALLDERLESTHLSGADLAAQPGIGEDAIRALARLPGIAQSGMSAQSNIRGGEAGEVLILLDGFELREAFHLPGYQSPFGVLDPGLIGAAEVYTGGFPARYGNRMAGVFDLQTIDPSQPPRRALGLSPFNASARHGGSFKAVEGQWLAGARAGLLRPVLQALAPAAGEPTFGDAYARLGFGDTDTMRVSGNLLWTRDELMISRPENGEQARIEGRTRYLWLRADRDWDSSLSTALWIGNSRIESLRDSSIDYPAISVGSVSDNRVSDFWDVRALLDWRASDKHLLQAGLTWTSEHADYSYFSEAVFSAEAASLFGQLQSRLIDLQLNRSRERFAAFASHRWRLTPTLVSEFGLRLQRTVTKGLSNETLYDPRLNLRWQLDPATSVRLHWGRFHQTDEVHELKVEDGQTQFPAAQRSDHLIGGIEHRFANGLSLRLEAFRKEQASARPHYENLLTRLSIVPDLSPDRILLAPTAAEIEGVELSASHDGRAVRSWASVSWSSSADLYAGREVLRSWDQNWAFSGGTDWTRGAWRFGAVAALHSGWPTTRIRDGSLQPLNAARLPLYASLDLRAEYQRPLAIGNLRLAAELSNALNRNNICCSDLTASGVPGGATRISTRERSWLPLLPSVSVLWEF